MAISIDRKIELNLKQKVAVTQSKYLGGKRGELVLSELPQTPAGLEHGMTAFEPDALGGIRRIITEFEGKWHEVYLFGPISNRDRKLISKHFGLNPTSEESTVTDYTGSMSFQRKYLITQEQKGGV